jgi:phosphoglucosamine mutase
MDRVREQIQAEYDDIQLLDGVRVETEGGWFLIRASGTQPPVRVTAEARDQQTANDLFERAVATVRRQAET